MSIALFGGTFDPVHNGHIRLVKAAVDALSPDELIVMPAAVSPAKQKSATPDEVRLAMCRAAFAAFDRVTVSSLEIERGEKSYTAQTLDVLKQRHPGETLILILGQDKLAGFGHWYRARDILAMAELALVSRRGEPCSGDVEAYAKSVLPSDGTVRILRVSPPPISSTEIREKVKKGEDITGFVPEKVKDIIMKEGLYRDR